MGSETVAATLPKSLLSRLFVERWRRPMQMIVMIVRRIPRRRPGKNPARMAVAGNLSHCATTVPFLTAAWVGVLLAMVNV